MPSAVSRRRLACRLFASKPWQGKQVSVRIGRMSRLKMTAAFVAAKSGWANRITPESAKKDFKTHRLSLPEAFIASTGPALILLRACRFGSIELHLALPHFEYNRLSHIDLRTSARMREDIDPAFNQDNSWTPFDKLKFNGSTYMQIKAGPV